jgi:hypothetical protein
VVLYSAVEVRFPAQTSSDVLTVSSSPFDRPCVKTPDARIGARKSRRKWALSQFLFLCGFCTARLLGNFLAKLTPKKMAREFSHDQDPYRTWRTRGPQLRMLLRRSRSPQNFRGVPAMQPVDAGRPLHGRML